MSGSVSLDLRTADCITSRYTTASETDYNNPCEAPFQYKQGPFGKGFNGLALRTADCITSLQTIVSAQNTWEAPFRYTQGPFGKGSNGPTVTK